jgi:hypothetical protein
MVGRVGTDDSLLDETVDAVHVGTPLFGIDDDIDEVGALALERPPQRCGDVDFPFDALARGANRPGNGGEVDDAQRGLDRTHTLRGHGVPNHSVLGVVENDPHSRCAIANCRVDFVVHEERAVTDQAHGLSPVGESGADDAGRGVPHGGPGHRRAPAARVAKHQPSGPPCERPTRLRKDERATLVHDDPLHFVEQERRANGADARGCSGSSRGCRQHWVRPTSRPVHRRQARNEATHEVVDLGVHAERASMRVCTSEHGRVHIDVDELLGR